MSNGFPDDTIYGWCRECCSPCSSIGNINEVTIREDGYLYEIHYTRNRKKPSSEYKIFLPDGFLDDMDACLEKHIAELNKLPRRINNDSIDGSYDWFKFRDFSVNGFNIAIDFRLEKHKLTWWDKLLGKKEPIKEVETTKDYTTPKVQSDVLCAALDAFEEIFKQHNLTYSEGKIVCQEILPSGKEEYIASAVVLTMLVLSIIGIYHLVTLFI